MWFGEPVGGSPVIVEAEVMRRFAKDCGRHLFALLGLGPFLGLRVVRGLLVGRNSCGSCNRVGLWAFF